MIVMPPAGAGSETPTWQLVLDRVAEPAGAQRSLMLSEAVPKVNLKLAVEAPSVPVSAIGWAGFAETVKATFALVFPVGITRVAGNCNPAVATRRTVELAAGADNDTVHVPLLLGATDGGLQAIDDKFA